MPKKSAKPLTTNAPRLRSQGYWAIILGMICFCAFGIGTFQLFSIGFVSIRLGHDPVCGDDAILLLTVLGAESIFFTGLGAFLLQRSRRTCK